jgi:hypothetical protein
MELGTNVQTLPPEDVELAFEALRQGNSLGRNVVAL